MVLDFPVALVLVVFLWQFARVKVRSSIVEGGVQTGAEGEGEGLVCRISACLKITEEFCVKRETRTWEWFLTPNGPSPVKGLLRG